MAEIKGKITTASVTAKVNTTASVTAKVNEGGTVEVPLEWVVISPTHPAASDPAILWINPNDTVYSLYIKVNGVWEGVKGFTGPVGPQGETGEPGVGIASIVMDADGYLTITNTDSSTFVSPISLKGPKGDKGENGEKGDKGDRGNQLYVGDTAPDPEQYEIWIEPNGVGNTYATLEDVQDMIDSTVGNILVEQY